jgi:hypothetical protein
VFTRLSITAIDPTTLVTDVDQRWMQLLAHPGVAESLSRTVDIFGIFSEPDQQASHFLFVPDVTEISWRNWRPRAEKACLDIRLRIKRQAICSISGVHWASDVTGYLTDPFQIPAAALEVHQYQHFENASQETYLAIFGLNLQRSEPGVSWKENWAPLVGKAPLIIGEFGYDDPPEYVQRLVAGMEKYQVSWAAWSLVGWAPKEGMIDCQKGTLLPLGEIIKSTLLSHRSTP